MVAKPTAKPVPPTEAAPEQLPRIVSLSCAARYLGIAPSTLGNWAKAGVFPTAKVGNRSRLVHSEHVKAIARAVWLGQWPPTIRGQSLTVKFDS